MSLDINLEYFVGGSMGYNLKSTEEYKKNIELCSKASEKVSKEIKEQSNEIFNSFTLNYQNSTKLIRDKIIKKKYQLVVGMGGSSAGAKAINMRIEGNVFFLDNYDPTYLQNFFKDYNIQKVMYHIFKSEWFYDDQNIGIKIKSPLELLVGIQTIIPIQFQKPQQLLYLQKMMGQILLNPPNVAGWKGGKSWIDSNTLMFRLKLPSILLNNAIINLESKGEFEDNFENYYKKNKKNYIKTLPSWNDFEKEYATVSIKELKKIILISNIDKDTEAFLDNLKFNSNKDLCIQLMSIPEYQLC